MSSSTEVATELLASKHISYIANLSKNHDLVYHQTTHLRMNAIYWSLSALHILNSPSALDKNGLLEYVLSCWDEEEGAFGAHPGHDAHLLSTLSAIQVLCMLEELEKIPDLERVVQWIAARQQPSGVFAGDRWGEVDTRFTFCAINALSLLGRLHQVDTKKTVDYIEKCKNFDGGFGREIGAESHSAQIYPCLGTLAILDRLDIVDVPTLAWWLAERQVPNGGLNGRPEKMEDVCYSFWVLSSLSILNKVHWIDAEKLTSFILSAQDPDNGGIADRPGDMTDVFHTVFGLAGLSILGFPGLQDLDPIYCMPAKLIQQMGLRKGWKILDRRTD